MNRLSPNRLLINRIFASLSGAILFLSVLLLATDSRAQNPSYQSVSSPFALDRKTVVPGKTLEPGSYTIRIVDHLKDRSILQVDDTAGTLLATFIGLPNPDFAPLVAAQQRGPIFWSVAPKGTAAFRGFSFSNGNTLEFVYPKDQAVTLAKLNSNTVPAIDPQSEGRKPDPKLSPEDREVVTLWMLKPTRVGLKGETPAIEAKRFIAPPETSAAPVQTAGAAAPLAQPKQATPSPTAQIARAQPSEAPRLHARVNRLPQTASDLPLVFLLALLLFSTAGVLRLARDRA